MYTAINLTIIFGKMLGRLFRRGALHKGPLIANKLFTPRMSKQFCVANKAPEIAHETAEATMMLNITREWKIRELKINLSLDPYNKELIQELFETYSYLGRHKDILLYTADNYLDAHTLDKAAPKINHLYKKALEIEDRQTGNYKKSRIELAFTALVLTNLILELFNSIDNTDQVSVADDAGEFNSNDSDDSISIIYKKIISFIKKPSLDWIIKSDEVHKQNVFFKDIKGIDEFREELEEIVDYLKNSTKYIEKGADLPKGVLLSGPPGTGKTMLAKALANEANCSFFFASGSEFDEVYVGLGAQRVRDLFKEAKKNAPAIIFIDEIDTVAGKRSANRAHINNTVNQILTEMDGFHSRDNVIVIGATNLAESIDSAFKRPGRFDKIINVSLPDVKGREEIIDLYLSKIKASDEVSPSTLARRTSGFSGAELKNLVNLSILNALKRDRTVATPEDFDFAYDRVIMGIGKDKALGTAEEKRATAIHEVGHAFASVMSEGAIPLYKVTILPKGHSLGHTAFIPEKDMLNMDKEKIIAQIDVALGGRAAEEVFLGRDEVTTGCSSDLQNATSNAYRYVRNYAMKEGLSLISAEKDVLSDAHNSKIDREVNLMLKTSLERVKDIMRKNEKIIMKIVDELLEKETLSADRFKEIIKASS